MAAGINLLWLPEAGCAAAIRKVGVCCRDTLVRTRLLESKYYFCGQHYFCVQLQAAAAHRRLLRQPVTVASRMRSIVMLALVFACVILLTSSGAQASSHATRAVELAEAPAPVPSSAASPSTASAPGPIPIVLPKESTLAISPVEKEALDDLRARVSAACRAMDFTVADVVRSCPSQPGLSGRQPQQQQPPTTTTDAARTPGCRRCRLSVT